MTTHANPTQGGTARNSTGIGSGWLVFAAVMMIAYGFMAIFAGIAAIAKDEVFVATRNYIYNFDLTGWGWIHLILGIVILLAGFALFSGATWARMVGVVLVGLAMVANFLWLPYTPFWSIVLIAIDVVVIWALCKAPGPSEI
ncbi:hypothetical protein ABZZ20_26820 [Streptomyces sp. NPDC006430]|uniref:DUF7144 family membrane protein n=1 Tax=Streptomyces sp. NPDC006430 TaxID=3154299 RepID=UPI0033AEB7A4